MKGPVKNILFILALMLLPLEAAATELYGSGCVEPCVYFVPPPPDPIPVVVAYPAPVVHVVTQPAVVVEEEPAVEHVVVEETVVHTAKPRPKVDIEIDAGVGMWIVPKLKETVNLSYDARLSLLVRNVIMTLSFNHVPGVEWEPDMAEESCNGKGNLSLVGMGFGYRWNKLGHFHPEIGAKLDALVLQRDEAKTVFAFGLGGTVGLMADFPLPYGSLMGGLQGEAHYHVWHQNGFFPPRATGALMAVLGYKF
jgi:hypothetical protein